MRIHPEGKTILFRLLLGLTFLNLLSLWLFSAPWWNNSLLLLSVIIYILVLQFFRNPGRSAPLDDHHIIAPADGKIVSIEEIEEPEYFKRKMMQISIFMSPLNVHVNRYPVSGEVIYAQYHPGAFLVAWHPKSSTLNERTTVVLRTSQQREIMYKQIAGAVARRIVMYASRRQNVIQGKDSGFIKFGSRVDVVLPLDADIRVKVGDSAKGGEQILATLK